MERPATPTEGTSQMASVPSPPEERVTLEDAITLIAEEAAAEHVQLTRTKLVKLLYFLDLKAFEAFGRTVSGVEWRWHHFGPYSEAIVLTCTKMGRAGELELERTENWFGSAEFRIRSSRPGYYRPPSPDLARLVKLVVKEFGRFAPSVLGDMSYDTEPMKRALSEGVRGVVIEFEAPVPAAHDVTRTIQRYADLARKTQGNENEGNVAEGLREESDALRPARESAMRRTLADA